MSTETNRAEVVWTAPSVASGPPIRIAVFGLGEAGGAIAADLAAAGIDVHAYDPRDVPTPAGVVRHAVPVYAVAGADLVCAFTAAADALDAMAQALEAIPPTAIYADFSTAAAGLKTRLGAIAGTVGIRFADVALMAPVPGKGSRTPALASGSGARRVVEVLAAAGMPIEYSGERAGQAATRKLLRSIVIKGLAAIVIESMQAAESAGLADETWGNLVDQVTAADEAFLRRIVDGTYRHSLRRLHEMEATADMLRELGVDAVMTRATVESLRRIQRGAAKVLLPGS